MTRETSSAALSILAILSLLAVPSVVEAAEQPNIILINCDDLGYADIGCFGSTKHRTPNIDRLAAEGMRLTSYYVTSGVCSPSRASLMTGCYPRRVDLHVDHQGGWVLFPRGKKGLNPSEVTMAEVLKEAGYATAIVGKWHLGDQPEFLPTRQGFDQYFGIPYSNDMGWTDRKDRRYPPLPVLRNEEVVDQEPDQRYLTQRYTKKAIDFIRARSEGPFFLYLPHSMPHWPQYASEDFAGRSANGKWGDAVEEIDWSTGQILETLAELGIEDRTLVLFMSDNGGAVRHGASNKPLRGGKGGTYEGGQRVCCVVRWPGRIPAGATCDELTTSMDLLPTFARLAGGTVPADRTIDGQDIWSLLSGQPGTKTPHEAFFYYWMGTLECVRSGPWKLRVALKRRKSQEPFSPQLFNLSEDIGEATDVAADHPEVVARLQKLAEQAREELGDDGATGSGQRRAGFVEDARALTGADD
ncbi:Arylsulfatase [Maioricimonas rarisocia]|uniref:Arylsulfatase n=1 Tax=Maioricimonas rarisocia TaxID=2528026 RepID=A0A517Z382_9PLAN|nr:sulfatase [Maioricimonas rarisocia]QDU36931.1 Arylsulfatase [Maioricimonas rarisocia]